MTGRVKFWNPAGWGIMTPNGVKKGDRQREVFIYSNKLPEGVHALAEMQEVECSIFPGSDPPRAMTVRLIDKQGYVPIDSGRKRGYGD